MCVHPLNQQESLSLENLCLPQALSGSSQGPMFMHHLFLEISPFPRWCTARVSI